MNIKVSENLELEIVQHFEEHQIQLQKQIELDFSSSDIIQYVTVGGGMYSFVKCILSYYEIKNKTRKMKIKNKDGVEIEIEASNVSELQELLASSTELLINEKPES